MLVNYLVVTYTPIRSILLYAVLMYAACGPESSLKTYSVILRSSDFVDTNTASISTTYNLVCNNVFGGSTNYTQNAIAISGTSGQIDILQNLTCTVTIASFFDGTSTYTPTSSALAITITAAGVVTSSGSLSSPPQYNNGSGSNLYFFLTASTSSSFTFEYAYDPAVQTTSISSPCTSGTCSSKPALSSISSSFNSTTIAKSNYIWFTSNLQITGLNTSVTTNIFVTDATVTFTSGSTYNVNVPDGIITLSPSPTCGTTTFSQSTWQTIMPTASVASNNIFAQGVAMPISTALPGSITPVTFQARFYADQPGISVKWQWGAAVYTTNITGYSTLGVKSGKSNDCSDVSSNPAGTPTAKKANVTRGATGSGGTQYTGGQSSTQTLTPSNCIPVCQGSSVRCPLICQAPPVLYISYR